MDRIKTDAERRAALVPLDVPTTPGCTDCGRPVTPADAAAGCPLCLRCQDPHTAALLDVARAAA